MVHSSLPPSFWNGFLEAAIHVQDNDGKLPIHLACEHGSNVALVRLLINKHPEGLKEKDNTQSIPLHYHAASFDAETETLKLLLERHPQGVHATDGNGNLPLHRAFLFCSMECIHFLVEVDPLP
jgi:ankyrin repeat protein